MVAPRFVQILMVPILAPVALVIAWQVTDKCAMVSNYECLSNVTAWLCITYYRYR